ncbi:MAG: tetratricopeptide repeat protein [Pseudomonadota bacterium]
MSFFSELQRRNVIRVATAYAIGTWLVLQVVDVLTGLLSLPDWTLRFVLMIAGVAFPFALIFSWVYEITPEGIKRESEIDRSQSITRETGGRLNTVIIGLLTIALAVLLADRFLSGEEVAAVPPETIVTIDPASIAVLPFDDYSGEEDRYFANGLTETLTSMLTSVQNLKVAGQTSAFSFLGANKSSQEIGEELSVAYLLRGSVQRSGERLRITANLIDSESDATVWSKVFDKQSADIFAIQDEIANTVVARVAADIVSTDLVATPEGVGTANTGAYDLYLKALEAKRPGSFEALEESETLLRSALALDPDYFEALYELSEVYLAQISTGMRSTADGEEALALARQALLVRPESINARVLSIRLRVGRAYETNDFESVDALAAEAAEILELPNLPPQARYHLSGYLQFYGQTDAAIELLDGAIDLDPLNPDIHNRRGAILGAEGRYSEARITYRRSLEIEPAQPLAWAALGAIDNAVGDVVSYIQSYDRAIEFDRKDPELPGSVAFKLLTLDLVDEAQPYIERVAEIAPNSTELKDLEMERAAARGDYQLLDSIVRQFILDDVRNRNGLYVRAAGYCVESALALGNLEEAMAFLNKNIPDFSDPYRQGASSKSALAREWIETYLLETYTEAERMAAYERFKKYNAFFGAEATRSDDLQLVELMFQDDLEGIRELYFDTIFQKHPFVSRRDHKRRIFDTELGEQLLEDAEVRSRVEAWDVALERAKSNVRKYLDSRQSI